MATEDGGEQGSTQAAAVAEVSSDGVPAEVTAKFNEVFGGGKAKEAEKELAQPERKPKRGEVSEAERRATALQKQRRQERKQEFFDGNKAEPKPAGAEGQPLPFKKGNSKTAPVSQQQSQASEDDEGSEGEQPVEKAAADPNKPTLNPVLRHAAKRAGWSEEEAQSFWEDNPEKAETYFTKMHSSQNALSEQFAQAGRQVLQSGNQQQAQPQQQSQQQQRPAGDPLDTLVASMYGAPLEKLVKDYNPEFVEEVLKRPAKYLQEHVIAPLRELMAVNERQNQKLVAQEAQNYLSGLEKDFGDFYGTSKQRSPEQQEAFAEMGQFADFIYAGAKSKGVPMSVSEALDHAHMRVAAKFLEVNERKKIAAQVKKRASQLTTRPTQRQQNNGQTGGKTIQKAMEALTNRAAELGISLE